jgi:hypothetical protein
VLLLVPQLEHWVEQVVLIPLAVPEEQQVQQVVAFQVLPVVVAFVVLPFVVQEQQVLPVVVAFVVLPFVVQEQQVLPVVVAFVVQELGQIVVVLKAQYFYYLLLPVVVASVVLPFVVQEPYLHSRPKSHQHPKVDLALKQWASKD